MTTPYVKVRASVNSGAVTSGGITVVDGDSVALSLQSTAGIASCLWEIYAYPSGYSTPSGWTEDVPGNRFYYLGLTPPALDMTGAPWGKYLIRATGNDGVRGGSVVVAPTDGTTMRDESTALSIRSASGLRDLATIEGTQFSASRSWVGDFQTNLRTLDAGALRGSYVGSIVKGSLGAGLTFTEDVTVTGVAATDSITVNAQDALPAGIVVYGFRQSANTVRIVWQNCTAGSVSVGTHTYVVAARRTV
jgi:hypothetical protein